MADLTSKLTINDYAYVLFCRGQKQAEGIVEHIEEKSTAPVADKLKLLNAAAEGFYSISLDTEDEDYIEATEQRLEKVLSLIEPNSAENIKTRNRILNRLYDFDEQLRPYNVNNRFNLIKRMVDDIKENNGEYDYDPLNTSARRIDYFMKKIPPQKRYSLLIQIDGKTVDKSHYNYSDLIRQTYEQYKKELLEHNQPQSLIPQNRFEQIQNEELPQAQTADEKIGLYNELLNLVDKQDWGRTRKFSEKTLICMQLMDLYDETGNPEARKKVAALKVKYSKAAYKSGEAARIKGYTFKTR